MKPTKLTAVVKPLLDDMNTPTSAFVKLDEKNSFLLESVSGGDQVARYSYIGLDPILELTATPDGVKTVPDIGPINTDPINALKEVNANFQVNIPDDANYPPFIGGAVGFFAWEVIGNIENIVFKNKEASDFPIAHFLFPRIVLAFDNAKRNIQMIAFVEDGQEATADTLLKDIEKRLHTPVTLPPLKESETALDFSQIQSNYSKEKFLEDVKTVKTHITDGDVFQLVLSQRFQIDTPKSPFDVYRQLRAINPSPYMYYFNFIDYQIVGSSPEILTSLSDNTATVRPIAGTRPRSQGNEDAVIKDLLSDEKECAEHIMLVDLGRNDLGRVCDYDTIKSSDLMTIEKYSHVLHIVSNVSGQLSKDKDAIDLFKATFPAGTLSGAPKIKAIQIIEDLEPSRRGPYGGALGYIDFRGNMDLCIVIRSIFARNGTLTIQAGAGIVADSIPEKEYEETQNKAKGMIQACL